MRSTRPLTQAFSSFVSLRTGLGILRPSRRALRSARADFGGRAGVIYFNNCFRRRSGGAMTGDHIDFWTGWSYMNELFRVSAGGDAGRRTDLFSRANQVWLFRLP